MTAQETSEKILQTASRLFVKNGYTATSMREIAAETGIGKATIYYHFPDKESIASALIKQTFSQMKDALQWIEAEHDPRQRIIVAVTGSVEYLLESADIISVLRREVANSREVMQNEFKGFFQAYMNLLKDAIQRGIDQGIFRHVDPESTTRVLMMMLQGSFAMVYLSGIRHRSNKDTASAILNVFFQGIDTR
jgi:TetR/AcrR family transcriptional regulator